MTTALVKTFNEELLEELEEVSAHNLRDAYGLAERRGFFGAPVEQFTQPSYAGRMLQVLRYRVQQQGVTK